MSRTRIFLRQPLASLPRRVANTATRQFKRPENPNFKDKLLRSPRDGWRTFLPNHAAAIAATDLCVVTTLTFERLSAA